jgi:fatty acyl-CoA reductase
MLQAYRKIHRFTDSSGFFSVGRWQFPINHVEQMWQKMSLTERDNFCFDMKTLNWEEYVGNALFGMRTYITKEDPNTIPKAKIRIRRYNMS